MKHSTFPFLHNNVAKPHNFHMDSTGRQQFVQQPTNEFFSFGGFNFSDEFSAALDSQLNLNTSLLGAPVGNNSSSIAPLGHCSSQQMVTSIVGLPSPPTSSPTQISLPSPPSYTNDSVDSPPGTPLTLITDHGTPGPSPSFFGLAHSPGSSSNTSQAPHRRHSSGSSVNDISSIPSLQVRVSILQQRVSMQPDVFYSRPTLQQNKDSQDNFDGFPPYLDPLLPPWKFGNSLHNFFYPGQHHHTTPIAQFQYFLIPFFLSFLSCFELLRTAIVCFIYLFICFWCNFWYILTSSCNV